MSYLAHAQTKTNHHSWCHILESKCTLHWKTCEKWHLNSTYPHMYLACYNTDDGDQIYFKKTSCKNLYLLTFLKNLKYRPEGGWWSTSILPLTNACFTNTLNNGKQCLESQGKCTPNTYNGMVVCQFHAQVCQTVVCKIVWKTKSWKTCFHDTSTFHWWILAWRSASTSSFTVSIPMSSSYSTAMDDWRCRYACAYIHACYSHNTLSLQAQSWGHKSLSGSACMWTPHLGVL